MILQTEKKTLKPEIQVYFNRNEIVRKPKQNHKAYKCKSRFPYRM